jgi:hypothetical protein
MADLSPFRDAFLHKTPRQLFTQGYLDDPIQFTTDVRLDPEVLIRKEDFFTVVTRDSADFAEINLAAIDPVYYPVSTSTPVYDRVKFSQRLDRTFTTF